MHKTLHVIAAHLYRLLEKSDIRFIRQTSLNERLKSLPDYPGSAMGLRSSISLSLMGAKETYNALRMLAGQERSLELVEIGSIPVTSTAESLRQLFNLYGSDKGNHHQYHLVYAAILDDLEGGLKSIAEIGLGTNNTDVPSNMGRNGHPGASLFAWRDFTHGKARVIGLDVDSRVLFQESPIETYFVDQLSIDSLESLENQIPLGSLDLFIDDGLHSPLANLNVLNVAPRFVRAGGYIVIEDISVQSLPIWHIVASLAPETWKITMYKARHSFMFVAKLN